MQAAEQELLQFTSLNHSRNERQSTQLTRVKCRAGDRKSTAPLPSNLTTAEPLHLRRDYIPLVSLFKSHPQICRYLHLKHHILQEHKQFPNGIVFTVL